MRCCGIAFASMRSVPFTRSFASPHAAPTFDRQLSFAEVKRETIRVDAAVVLEALQHVCDWAQRCGGGQEAENRCTPAHRSQRSLRVINANVHLVHRSVRLDKAPVLSGGAGRHKR